MRRAMRRILSVDECDHRVETVPDPDGVHLRIRIEGDPDSGADGSGDARDGETRAAPLPGGFHVTRGQRTLEVSVVPDGKGSVVVVVEGEAFRVGIGRSRRANSGAAEGERRDRSGGAGEVRTPMPGKVVRILRRQGDPVEAGDGVLVFEAMKMQNEIRAPASGVIARMKAAAGTPFDGDELLFAVEPRVSS